MDSRVITKVVLSSILIALLTYFSMGFFASCIGSPGQQMECSIPGSGFLFFSMINFLISLVVLLVSFGVLNKK